MWVGSSKPVDGSERSLRWSGSAFTHEPTHSGSQLFSLHPEASRCRYLMTGCGSPVACIHCYVSPEAYSVDRCPRQATANALHWPVGGIRTFTGVSPSECDAHHTPTPSSVLALVPIRRVRGRNGADSGAEGTDPTGLPWTQEGWRVSGAGTPASGVSWMTPWRSAGGLTLP